MAFKSTFIHLNLCNGSVYDSNSHKINAVEQIVQYVKYKVAKNENNLNYSAGVNVNIIQY